MGIITVEAYTAKCDVCNTEAEFGDFSCLCDESSVKEDATKQGWYFDVDDKCYCGNCHYLDKDDNLHFYDKSQEL